MANKQENPMACIRVIESLHSLTNDIDRIIDLATSMTGGASAQYSRCMFPPVRDVSQTPV